GLVGYLSYESITDIEKIPLAKNKSLKVPRSSFIQTETCIAFDHTENQIFIICNVYLRKFSSLKKVYDQALKKIDKIREKLDAPAPPVKKLEIKDSFNPLMIRSNQNKIKFIDNVRKAKEYIK